jgi:hypothetical protein
MLKNLATANWELGWVVEWKRPELVEFTPQWSNSTLWELRNPNTKNDRQKFHGTLIYFLIIRFQGKPVTGLRTAGASAAAHPASTRTIAPTSRAETACLASALTRAASASSWTEIFGRKWSAQIWETVLLKLNIRRREKNKFCLIIFFLLKIEQSIKQIISRVLVQMLLTMYSDKLECFSLQTLSNISG